MIERDDLDMLAAEFVLGTLPVEDRQRVQRLRTTHPELDAQILQWESRLSALNDEIEPVDPAPGLFARIERSIDQLEQASSQHNEVVRLRQQVSRWRLSTAAASIAAMLLIAVMMLEPTPTKSPYVAVFQHNDEQPAFLLTVDLARKQLNIQPVTARPAGNQSYQLWIKDDELGPTPRSVGVLNEHFEVDPAALTNYDAELLRRATFGISLEPRGGSPTGQPTGPALHGFLYPTGEGADTNRL
ncbi:anti-sigma factor domain-containing protein [Marinobacter nauticus]|uniref:anti-sigma factor n=1 Tax=Marinobacter nauticus TaxID=2743 RepID=UPI001C55C0B7|nr:anti-sigma factor [Marinobacter nauticus]MBW3199569.1 anti-sigma factor [Marinobacter nauticus]MBY5939205.1 anti-sigma factor [Marinobacter nauticus]MBY5956399.1 anti-sigma factor [Marinobacter nauticus]MBY6010190.1 anti-sigma factor [Marinobacter nauticus]MBY6184979.1 anti-sigma factor [Marinobacter nauticus]